MGRYVGRAPEGAGPYSVELNGEQFFPNGRGVGRTVAYCILFEELDAECPAELEARAHRLQDDFFNQVISKAGAVWRLSSEDIAAWMRARKAACDHETILDLSNRGQDLRGDFCRHCGGSL